jgi:hypothetical protein
MEPDIDIDQLLHLTDDDDESVLASKLRDASGLFEKLVQRTAKLRSEQETLVQERPRTIEKLKTQLQDIVSRSARQRNTVDAAFLQLSPILELEVTRALTRAQWPSERPAKEKPLSEAWMQAASAMFLLSAAQCAWERVCGTAAASPPVLAAARLTAVPVLERFWYHFGGERHLTNRIDKPEWMLTHALTLLREVPPMLDAVLAAGARAAAAAVAAAAPAAGPDAGSAAGPPGYALRNRRQRGTGGDVAAAPPDGSDLVLDETAEKDLRRRFCVRTGCTRECGLTGVRSWTGCGVLWTLCGKRCGTPRRRPRRSCCDRL